MDRTFNNRHISMGTDISDYVEGARCPQKTWVTKNIPYMNNFLASQIGHSVTAVFVFPDGAEITKSGRLITVGENYIVLSDSAAGESTVCSTDALNFVSIS